MKSKIIIGIVAAVAVLGGGYTVSRMDFIGTGKVGIVYIAILDEQIELLKVERLEKARCYQKIERQIKQMENEDEQEVLRLRYITGLKWEEVALKMNYSWKWIHKIHGRALQNFKI